MIEISSSSSSQSAAQQNLLEAWKKVVGSREAGFTRLPSDDNEWTALQKRLDDCRDVRRVLVIGIGGSSLGAQVIYECFRPSSSAQLFFLESPSPHAWTSLRSLGPDWIDNHTVIVSKSGNTLETLIWVERLAAQDPSYLNPANCTVIASPGEGALQQWARKENIPTLWIPKDVGGRFSVLSAAGMFPAGMMGLSLHEFRDGAEWALTKPELAAQLGAEALAAWKRESWVTQMWTYSESLKFFGEWWQQLWSESLGKKQNRAGGAAPRVSTPMSCRGPRDQHSLVQQLIEGPSDKYVFVNRVKTVEDSDGAFEPRMFPEMPFFGKDVSLGKVMGVEAEAFERSLAEAKVGYSTISLKDLNERSLGALFMIWQMTIAMLGEHLNINTFDQPGVELGKRHANQILRA